MTSYDTSGNVLTEVQDISNYTISASGTITEAQFVRFLAKSDVQVGLDNPGWSQVQANEANALLICHYIARKLGKSGKTSESLGKGSYSKKLTGQTSWMDDYDDLISRVKNVDYPISSLSTDGLARSDTTINKLRLDAATVVRADDLIVNDTRGTIADLLGG